jgi:uncharacterized protein (TIGR00369 family)
MTPNPASPPEVALPRYARALGVVIDHWDDGVPVLALEFGPIVGGNPGTVHGGALGGLLDAAGQAAVRAGLRPGSGIRTDPLSLTIEYLRAAQERRTYARGTIVRAGRRLANVRVTAWQEDMSRPVATAFLNLLIHR